MKTKTIIKPLSEIRAEFAKMPTASRNKDRAGMRVTEHGTLTRLQPGMVIEYDGSEWRVDMVNHCRARCVSLNKRKITVQFKNPKGETVEFQPETTGGSINISPNSECRILRRQ